MAEKLQLALSAWQLGRTKPLVVRAAAAVAGDLQRKLLRFLRLEEFLNLANRLR